MTLRGLQTNYEGNMSRQMSGQWCVLLALLLFIFGLQYMHNNMQIHMQCKASADIDLWRSTCCWAARRRRGSRSSGSSSPRWHCIPQCCSYHTPTHSLQQLQHKHKNIDDKVTTCIKSINTIIDITFVAYRSSAISKSVVWVEYSYLRYGFD